METDVTQTDILRHLDALTKPIGSLGRLEDLAARLCQVQRTFALRTAPRRVVLFAADHGVVEAGVTALPFLGANPGIFGLFLCCVLASVSVGMSAW
jgi:NaMN:DMB phosphoribosyltransferase